MKEVIVTYDSTADAKRALKKLRRYGLRSPRDHLIVEGFRVLLLALPIILVGSEVISPEYALVVYCGYFASRWLDLFVKPTILRFFGPRLPINDFTSSMTLIFDEIGVKSDTENGLLRLNWQAVPAPRVFADGLILRIAPEQSLVVEATHLPEGISPQEFGKQINEWRAGAQS